MELYHSAEDFLSRQSGIRLSVGRMSSSVDIINSYLRFELNKSSL